MKILKYIKNGYYIIKPVGVLNIDSRKNFENELSTIVNGNYKKIAINFNKISYIDSTCLGVLIFISNKLKIDNLHLIIYGLNPMITNLFKITKLDLIFNIKTSKEFLKLIKKTK